MRVCACTCTQVITVPGPAAACSEEMWKRPCHLLAEQSEAPISLHPLPQPPSTSSGKGRLRGQVSKTPISSSPKPWILQHLSLQPCPSPPPRLGPESFTASAGLPPPTVPSTHLVTDSFIY